MTKLTDAPTSALETIFINKCSSANDFNRHAMEALVKKQLAVKHYIGIARSYTLTPLGRLTWSAIQRTAEREKIAAQSINPRQLRRFQHDDKHPAD